jgi:hypothetical protein
MMCNGNDLGLPVILTFVFRNVHSLRERYGSNVPTNQLEQMDIAKDWPVGLAAEALKRLNRDPQLRKRLSVLADAKYQTVTERYQNERTTSRHLR